MSLTAPPDPVLNRFRQAIDEAYGSRVERAVLFGSRARGEGRGDSDYDVAVFLRNVEDRGLELDRLADIGTDILYEHGTLIHAIVYPAGTWRDRSPLMHEIRRDGIDL